MLNMGGRRERAMLDRPKPVHRVVDEARFLAQVPHQGHPLSRALAMSSQVQRSASQLALDCVSPVVLAEARCRRIDRLLKPPVRD